jgi:hypothetical protein
VLSKEETDALRAVWEYARLFLCKNEPVDPNTLAILTRADKAIEKLEYSLSEANTPIVYPPLKRKAGGP